jgi:hypothetical protein
VVERLLVSGASLPLRIVPDLGPDQFDYQPLAVGPGVGVVGPAAVWPLGPASSAMTMRRGGSRLSASVEHILAKVNKANEILASQH